ATLWPALAVDDAHERAALIAAADDALAHRWDFFDIDVIEPVIDWHADPVAGISAPRIFGSDINHRDERLVGDIKVTWEKSRHHHLTILAAAYHVTRDERYAAEVADQLRSWVDENPVLIGVNWTHALESGIRLISWVWCDRLLRGSVHHARAFGDDSPLWASIWQQQRFIAGWRSRGSSANNHLIGEMAGLYVAASAWPLWPQSARWAARARRSLEREALAQTCPSGINREMAFSYQLFVAEFYLVSLNEARRSGDTFSAPCRERLKRMIEAIWHLRDARGNLPRYGDEDDGVALRLQPEGPARLDWILSTGRALLDAVVPARKSLTSTLMRLPAAGPSSVPLIGPRAWPDAGLYLLANRRGTSREVFVLADAGPLGFLSIAAHGHADANAFTLSVGGVALLVDPGTYAYHTNKRWRSYFRSTAAHNTVTVDGADQSEQRGAFLWTRKARAQALAWSAAEHESTLTAEHDGYRHLGVRHRRTWRLAGDRLAITDLLVGRGDHRVAHHLHCHPECVVEADAHGVHIRREGIRVRVVVPGGFSVEIMRGGDEGGWFSAHFGHREPAATIRMSAQVRAGDEWLTTLEMESES
ncbi:MAG: alginate lyase family protein, partial [Planctomycetes bacterium]|nr:alginate lyase family protein [Planctomycetota bacterium]